MKPADTKTLSALFLVLGAISVVVALPTIRDTLVVLVGAIIGAVLLMYLATLLKKRVGWARDILLITFGLMTILAILTLLTGFAFTWVVIGLAALYITWSLLVLEV